MYMNDNKLTTTQDIVNSFANYFHSVFEPRTTNVAITTKDISNNEINLNIISVDEIILAIRKLKSNLTAGSDLVSNIIIKDCAYSLSIGLFHIFYLALK